MKFYFQDFFSKCEKYLVSINLFKFAKEIFKGYFL